jgi:hypothetical protein
MYVVFPAIALKAWNEPKGSARKSMETALANGVLSSEEFHVASAIEVDESEDEGLHYFLAVATERTLFLSGQYLYGLAEGGRFPSTRIRVYWHATLGCTFGVECLGEPLAPARKEQPFSVEDFDSNRIPEDRTVLPRRLEEVVAVFFQTQSASRQT